MLAITRSKYFKPVLLAVILVGWFVACIVLRSFHYEAAIFAR